MDEEFVERRPGDLETYRRLDAFAHARLAPNATSMARIRTARVAEALQRVDARGTFDVAAHAVVPLRRNGSWILPRRRVSRAMGALLAATLTLAVVAGGVAASAPGGPLYGPRLWLEEATLPAGATERADAQVERLDDRLAEVRAALASDDSNAATAALEAYESILTELQAQAMADPAIGDRVLDDVTRHQAVLEALLGTVPPQAQDALRHALDRSDNAVDHLNGSAGAGDGSGRPASPGAGGTEGPGGGNPAGGPDRTPVAAPPTHKPAKADPTPRTTPKPAKTPAAATPTEKPAKTSAPEAKPTAPEAKPTAPEAEPTDAEAEPTERPDRTPRSRSESNGRH